MRFRRPELVGVLSFFFTVCSINVAYSQSSKNAGPHISSQQLIELDKRIYNARNNSLQSGERRIVGAEITVIGAEQNKDKVNENWMTEEFRISLPPSFNGRRLCADFADANAQYRRTSLLKARNALGTVSLKIDIDGAEDIFKDAGVFIAYPASDYQKVSDACGVGEPISELTQLGALPVFPAQINQRPMTIADKKVLMLQVNSGGGQAYTFLLDNNDAPLGEVVFCRESSVQNGLFDQVCEVPIPPGIESPVLFRLDVQQPGYPSDFLRVMAWFDQGMGHE